MYERFNISLRLPAHLFVEKDCEEMVVDKIKECYSKINTSWTLKFSMNTDLINKIYAFLIYKNEFDETEGNKIHE